MEAFFMKKLIAIILLSATALIQTDNSQLKWLTEEISRYNDELSANATLSEQELTLEMPDCSESTYVYLRNNNQYQRVLLTSTKNTETIRLIKSPNITVFIIPAQQVESYIDCRQENIKLLKKLTETQEASKVEDARPSVKQAQKEHMQGALKECGNLKEMFVTQITGNELKKHIILPTYEEVLNFQKKLTTKNQEFQQAHPNHGQTMQLYIPEQTLKFSIKQSNS